MVPLPLLLLVVVVVVAVEGMIVIARGTVGRMMWINRKLQR